MNRDEARELFAMVLQETWLFRGTVAENVAYGRPQATREEIVKACDEAYCGPFHRGRCLRAMTQWWGMNPPHCPGAKSSF